MDFYLKHILLFYPLIKNSKKKKLFIHKNTAYSKVHHSFAHFYLQYSHLPKFPYTHVKESLHKHQGLKKSTDRVHIYIMKTIY